MSTMSISELVAHAASTLTKYSDSPKLDAQLLLCNVLDKPRSYLSTWPEKKLSEQDTSAFNALLTRRKKGEPIAYIVGVREFWSLPLKVASCTLIPRPDTEVLVEQVLTDNHLDESEHLTVLDLGTGTGAIALALASERPNWQVDAIDFNEEAVSLAKENATALNLAHVNIYQSSWFDNVADEKQFDIIVSNPPYIDGNDVHLTQGDVRFEPKSALVADEHGLGDIETIANRARDFLNTNGQLYFEHGFEQAERVRAILTDLGYSHARTINDYNGNPRVTTAKWQ